MPSEENPCHKILPYTRIVGQEQLKLALELSYIAKGIGGVLLSGNRGSGKSTAVRAFGLLAYGELPVTLPMNATEDRVIGGWQIDALMKSEAKWQDGLLVEASKDNKQILYIDEVNLLDDRVVNIILDATSTGILEIQREGESKQELISFTLIGTMNPEEGGLRPQLLDRFGLTVNISAEKEAKHRTDILKTVLEFDRALSSPDRVKAFFEAARPKGEKLKQKLDRAKKRLYDVEVPDSIADKCAEIAEKFDIESNRGDYTLALAARALAAYEESNEVATDHIREVAAMALQHRRPMAVQSDRIVWSTEDDARLDELLSA
ncbi:AAA family ATPase [Pseudanabaena sp. PCC 6802]|uniref:AAA family ATPase n=1 Tax=Pseudanabaena sp. PCC 6802 TaxID=118173 RepID=UPI0003480F84|nr:AAA family ATPase [Pseudanabaena sp. PCC 6802]